MYILFTVCISCRFATLRCIPVIIVCFVVSFHSRIYLSHNALCIKDHDVEYVKHLSRQIITNYLELNLKHACLG